jgi:hypothetical protein
MSDHNATFQFPPPPPPPPVATADPPTQYGPPRQPFPPRDRYNERGRRGRGRGDFRGAPRGGYGRGQGFSPHQTSNPNLSPISSWHQREDTRQDFKRPAHPATNLLLHNPYPQPWLSQTLPQPHPCSAPASTTLFLESPPRQGRPASQYSSNHSRDHQLRQKPQSTPAAPAVPSFLAPLLPTPPAPTPDPSGRKPKRRKHNGLGLTPSVHPQPESDDDADQDEEALLATRLAAGFASQQYRFPLHTPTLASPRHH